MSKELRFITKNGHKVREFQSLFANTQYMIVPAAGHSDTVNFGIQLPLAQGVRFDIEQ
jgi:inosine/xanthosine triphosphate pyrophosphatase family protein